MKNKTKIEINRHVRFKPHIVWSAKLLATVTVVSITILGFSFCPAWAYSDEQIVRAIYLAEGGEKTKYPFGIRSVKCDGYKDCEKVCYNTVKNNRKRYKEYWHKSYPDFLSFLASRYCPIGAENDPTNLNRHWIKNVRFFLERGE